MGKLFSIGELLIDFIPQERGIPLKDVKTFERTAGGAPANVAAAVAKYGRRAVMITKLGEDAFGDYLQEQLQLAGVETDKIIRTKEANTGLAFVSLKTNGEREFSFYRKPSADLLLSEDEIDSEWFDQGDILHFCSVSLVESPMKAAHRRAIMMMKEKGGLISFDPNVRLPLWEDPFKCREAIHEFLPLANLVKVSDEELEFITGEKGIEEAIASLFVGSVQAVIYTKGAAGAELFTKEEKWTSPGFSVTVQDTTGAGDAFIGGFLYMLLDSNVTPTNLVKTLNINAREILPFANASGALTATGKGAISALPEKAQVLQLIEEQKGEKAT